MIWDCSIELSAEKPFVGVSKFSPDGSAYFQKKFRMDRDTVQGIIDHQWEKDPLTGPLELRIYFYLAKEGQRGYPYTQKYLNELEDYIIRLAEGILFKSKNQIILKQSAKLYAKDFEPHINLLIRKL